MYFEEQKNSNGGIVGYDFNINVLENSEMELKDGVLEISFPYKFENVDSIFKVKLNFKDIRKIRELLSMFSLEEHYNET